MAIQISENLYDRQRSAEYFFQSIVHADQEDDGYKYPANLFLRSVENLVNLNVRSKSISLSSSATGRRRGSSCDSVWWFDG